MYRCIEAGEDVFRWRTYKVTFLSLSSRLFLNPIAVSLFSLRYLSGPAPTLINSYTLTAIFLLTFLELSFFFCSNFVLFTIFVIPSIFSSWRLSCSLSLSLHIIIFLAFTLSINSQRILSLLTLSVSYIVLLSLLLPIWHDLLLFLSLDHTLSLSYLRVSSLCSFAHCNFLFCFPCLYSLSLLSSVCLIVESSGRAGLCGVNKYVNAGRSSLIHRGAKALSC